jgi:glycosyltransferase involved in cell wall biosynthesis
VRGLEAAGDAGRRGRGARKAGDVVIRVAFDNRATKHTTGIARYARSLLRALGEAERLELTETHGPRAGGTDVYHSPWIDGALLRPAVPMVVTLHDLIPLKRPGEYLRSGVRFRLRYLALSRATRVIVPTQAVARDAEAMLGLTAERLVVIGEAADPEFYPRGPAEIAVVRERYGLPERYLLWVGGLQTPDPRKRVAALARARRELPLVLVGATGHWARELANVTLTGLVPDADLAAIYSGAHAVVYPSDDEGFGLVPVEALACGTPVCTCDIPALREVLAGRASFSPAGDLDGLIRAAEAAVRPAPPALPSSWTDVAAATVAVYRDAIAAASGANASRPPRPPRPPLPTRSPRPPRPQ